MLNSIKVSQWAFLKNNKKINTNNGIAHIGQLQQIHGLLMVCLYKMKLMF